MDKHNFDNRQIKKTADGSKTLYLPDIDEHYHSFHGAIQESLHVFIKAGLQQFNDVNINLLEIGFGTGLNALLTAVEAESLKLNIDYTGIEAYPVSLQQAENLEYCQHISHQDCQHIYQQLHTCPWELPYQISKDFKLTKRQIQFQDLNYQNTFDLIYYDAFGARVQPELWAESLFKLMYQALKPNGLLVTYSAKGSVRRAMQTIGFTVERLQGPPGKREMLRAKKIER